MSIFVELGAAPAQEADGKSPFCSGTITLTRGRHPVGRGMPELDGIKDNRVSRQQVEIIVEEDAAYVVRLGRNPSTLGMATAPHDPKTLITGHKTPLSHGDVLSLLPDTYPLTVKIVKGEAPTSSGDSNKATPFEQSAQSPAHVQQSSQAADPKKRKADAPADNAAAAKAHAFGADNDNGAQTTAPLPPPPSVAPPPLAVAAKGGPARTKSKAPPTEDHSSDEIMGQPPAAPAAAQKPPARAKSKAAHSSADDLVILDDVSDDQAHKTAAAKRKKTEPPSQEKKGTDAKGQAAPASAKDGWLREINGDLFTTTASIVHCVSKDLAMSKGIAKVIYDRYLDPKKIADLERQDKSVGDVAVARIGDKRFIFNLITKNKFFDKPVYEALEASLIELRERCLALSVDQLAMPQIGCGMDKLEWHRVRQILVNVFGDGKITVSVYNISTHNASPAKHNYSPPAAAAAASAPHHSPSSSPVVKKPTGPAPKLTWKEEGTLLVYDSPSLTSAATTVAGFDLDGTLIQPKSGNKFPKGRDDWKWLYPSVPSQLRTLHHNGTRVIIISNQKGITGANGKARKEDITGKLTDIVAQLGIPVQCFVATAGDHWRKPNSDIWDLITQRSSTQPNAATSFYVGDAAGRKGDHSDSDRGFAVNAGIGFFTPEQYFLGQKPEPFAWKGFDPASVKDAVPVSLSFPPHRELVICVGPPAIGKSTFVTRTFVPKGYVRVNQDQLGTKEKCIAEADAALASGKSVVIDNTNPARATRAQYLALAKKYNVRARCLVFATDVKLAKHLNHLRERLSGTSLIPDIAYRMFASKFEEPAQSEGFEQVVKIPFVPDFSSAKHKRLYHQRTSPS